MLEQEQNIIRVLRSKTGMTQKQFSEFYNIPQRTLEGWESGRRTPAQYVISLLAKAVEIDFTENGEK